MGQISPRKTNIFQNQKAKDCTLRFKEERTQGVEKIEA